MFNKLLILLVCHFVQSNSGEAEKELINALIPERTDEKLNYKFAKLVTPPHSRSKRETRPVEFQVDNEVIRLSLTPVAHDVLNRDLPVWTVESDSTAANGHLYKRVDEKDTNLDGTFYEDLKNKAILYAFYKEGKIFYEGVVGEGNGKKVIKPVPEKWYEGNSDHVIFEVDEHPTNTSTKLEYPFYYKDEPKLKKPLDTLHPKLLLVVEYNYFKMLGENISETVKYLSILLSAVQLQYNKIPYPKVHIQITGIIIQKDSTALEFINLARYGMQFLNGYILMVNGTNYFQNEFEKEVNFKNYHSAIVLSNLSDGIFTGRAAVSQICNKTVIYCQQPIGYLGVRTIAHELGHSLGLTHDEDESFGNPPANASILFPAGYVWVDKFYWSEQNINELRIFSSLKRAECLKSSYRNYK